MYVVGVAKSWLHVENSNYCLTSGDCKPIGEQRYHDTAAFIIITPFYLSLSMIGRTEDYSMLSGPERERRGGREDLPQR